VSANLREPAVSTAQPAAAAPALAPLRWLTAVIETARPRQWPKNLLVFAAPLAGASLGRDEGFWYALLAAGAFTAASAAVYFINDAVDAERDRQHPVKRLRAVASGRLPRAQAMVLAAAAAAAAVTAGFWAGRAAVATIVAAYLILSICYSLALKHVPVAELLLVASGFVLRALGGAAATHVPPSGWFLVVCSLGALMVAIAKRFTELDALGSEAASHRPVMRWYSPQPLRWGQRLVAVAMIIAYLMWAYHERDDWMRAWHLASVLPLSVALIRFDQLAGRATGRPVEDLISRDGIMVCCEITWLTMFAVGL
jgi:decaprenyl-phosphate phosphoribosyltransferase